MKCFECGVSDNLEEHHVVPRSRGGTKTVTLCTRCHGRVHGVSRPVDLSTLIRESLQKRRTQGKPLGRPSLHRYGYDAVGGLLVENEEEQATIALVKRLRADKTSYKNIVMHLTQRNMFNRSGDPFRPSYLCKLALRDGLNTARSPKKRRKFESVSREEMLAIVEG